MKSPKSSKEKARKRLGLTKTQIINSAITYADTHGIETLSMRILAAQLGCGVMSLYNHVADKDDLLDGMIDAVACEIDLPTTAGDRSTWSGDLRNCAISAYKVMLNHAWAAKTWGRMPGPAKNRYHEAILRTMREAGLPEELSCRGFHALTMHVVGFALQVLELPFSSKEEVHELGHRALDDLNQEAFPYLREHVHFHLSGKDQRNDFKYMLDLILDGLERDFAASQHKTKV